MNPQAHEHPEPILPQSPDYIPKRPQTLKIEPSEPSKTLNPKPGTLKNPKP